VSPVLVAVGSLKGSPGVTTLVVVLAAVWPGGPATVLEADCAGGDLGGRCWLPDTPGLASLATGARAGSCLIAEHIARLRCGVPVVVAPASRQAATIAVGLLAESDPRTWASDQAVIADVGRLDPGLPSSALAWTSSVLLIVSGGDEASLLRLADADLPRERAHLVLVGGCAYPVEDVAAAVGLPVAGQVPWDPRAAAVAWGQRPPGTSWTSRGLPAAARALAHHVAAATTTQPPENDGHRAPRSPSTGPLQGRRLGSRT
jgi:hypothetical protein